jgi:1-deoxy-D-xylulose-5-phosphate reductoisomerase
MKRMTILGSTGSIGTNCLNVVRQQIGRFEVRYMSTFGNADLLFQQAKEFHPAAVTILDNTQARRMEPEFKKIGVEVYSGFEGLLEISGKDDVDILVNALVGAVGLQPTLNALKPGRRIALANKETLVIGGQLVMQQAEQIGAEVIPIDSEHSALLQCLTGEDPDHIRRIILTASGGPFRNLGKKEFSGITVEQALDHPNWDMGAKITIDSATLMNKGLEVIEAHWLFGLQAAKINVVIHPQSIIHSLVEFVDGSLKAQLGVPDMQIPIQYALTYPARLAADMPRLDFATLTELTFEQPDFNKFRCLKLAYDSMAAGGGAPAVMNAANEEAVNLFLTRKIRFDQIATIVEDTLCHTTCNHYDHVDNLLEYDRAAREYVLSNYHAKAKAGMNETPAGISSG